MAQTTGPDGPKKDAENKREQDEQGKVLEGAKQEQISAVGGLDSEVAAVSGLSEGEVKTLRYESGLNQSAGHNANLHAWEQTAAGQAFKAAEKDREKEAKEEEKRLQAATNDKQVDEAAQKYLDAIGK